MSEIVKYRTVQISVYPWTHPSGREYWRFKAGASHVTRSTLAKAKKAALAHAQTIFKGGLPIEDLTPEQITAMKRMIEADPTCRLVDEFLVWHGRRAPKKNSKEAIDEFLAAKEDNRGKSHYNVANLKRHLAKIPNKVLSDITTADLPAIPGAARTKKNVISAWITFFKWCVKREYLPYDEPTVAERLDKPIVIRGIPSTYTPAQLKILLKNVTPSYLPWLACGALAGVRTEETCPSPESDKSPLDWADFHWDRDLIIVRPETDKNGHRRVVPILPALRAILWPIKKESGRMCPKLPPHTPQKGGKQAETTRLGKFIGGWKRNALRHSWISYRAAEVGLAQTAMEGGNSESEAKRSYNDAKGKDEAKVWFSTGIG